jgi:hypothetical protein
MTETSTNATLYQVNPDPADPATGHAVTGLILATAHRRAHLRDAIVSFEYSTERGIGIRVDDAGQRQHLANALGFDTVLAEFRVPQLHGKGISRSGTIEDIPVYIWNLEL